VHLAPERVRRIRAFFPTLIFYPMMTAWIVAGVVFSPLAIAAVKIATGWEMERVARYLIKIHGRGVMWILSPFVRFEKENLEDIPLPCIMVVNHLSFFDSYYMASMPFFDLTFAVGAWPFRMFWYTAMMRLARYLEVDSLPWPEAVEACGRAASRGGAILFFPEGHRSRSGELQKFYSGAFRMAIETGLPLVPLCITGTQVLLPPGRRWLHPSRVRLKALSPLNPADFQGPAGPARMRDLAREKMAANLENMQVESP
jgi:1-acyl-sn-glycerol-3-phosphate acyltransferase